MIHGVLSSLTNTFLSGISRSHCAFPLALSDQTRPLCRQFVLVVLLLPEYRRPFKQRSRRS
ncbi:hypothetical protein B0H67DRAFT_578212 [Lasiosphaeris hirsuta]|uniref:Uncharacterized protein n=1 Tax=Lasiosphaeris hirsuta TaxID=260670 RepID=A0AA40ASE1_9PEZI|nr:hypothetical protein B0H67DRAFT_578212 [Lasiosphaeris hirsuta]